MKLKVCGLSRPVEVETCIKNDVNFCGFILNYSKSDLYSNEEKAVLNLAFASGSAPNNANQKHFDELNKYYSDSQIIDIVAVISLFGFLNRWSDTMQSDLEPSPAAFSESLGLRNKQLPTS